MRWISAGSAERWPRDSSKLLHPPVETALFAHLKRILKLDRLRLRGPNGAHDEFLVVATAQNLRRMARRPMPEPGR